VTDPPTAPPSGSPRPSGHAGARLHRWKIVVLAVIGLAIVAGVAIAVLVANEPSEPEAPCKPGVPCLLARDPGTLSLGKTWVSRDLGYSFEYPGFLTVSSSDGRSAQLGVKTTSGYEIQIWVTGARAADSSVDELVTARQDALNQRVLGLSEADGSPDRIMAPGLGFLRGDGGAFTGTLDSPTGPSSPADVAILAAGDGRTNVVLSILITGEKLDHDHIQSIRNATGVLIVNSLRYR
jgi:hypothetical protein